MSVASWRRLLLAWAMLPLAAGAQAQGTDSFNVASYNLRLNTELDGANAWPERREAVKRLVRYHEFDVFGTQEALADQIEDLSSMDEFDHVGVGRDDGRRAGEHSAIFYRRARFVLLEAGNFWLSQTPDVPSLGWDARCCKRIASWAKLSDRRSGKLFYFFSVHFDHQGLQARRESARLMVRKIAQIAGAAPVICAGDFNSTPGTEQVEIMRGLLADAYAASATAPYGPVGTFNGFQIDAALNDRIDYVFVSTHLKVWKYAALTDSSGGRFPSDHLPVLVKLEIAATNADAPPSP